jgi:hypothetical protein
MTTVCKDAALQNRAPISSNLAHYVITVNADAPPIEVYFIEESTKSEHAASARSVWPVSLLRSLQRYTMQPVFAFESCR